MPLLTISTLYTLNLATNDWEPKYFGVVRDESETIVAMSRHWFHDRMMALRAAQETRHEMIATGNY